jgi:small subunit ribosomal protein S1
MLFQVIEVDRQRERLILSAKKARKEIRQQRLRELQSMEGEVISGRISNLASFGAFVDLDGVEGLIHISEISWEKIDRAADILSPGDEVEVLIQSVDVDRERVSLSRKSLLPSPWDSYSQEHVPGDLVEGVVTGVADFGAFVRVAEGIEGLVHISEMRGAQDFAAKDLLYPGDTIPVRILKIEPERQRLSLSQRRVRSHEEIDWIQTRQRSETEPQNQTEAL